jgi:hypothetical protein
MLNEMKLHPILKKFIFALICIFVVTSVIFSQDNNEPPNQVELGIWNNSGGYIYVQIYPVSMVFNGYDFQLQSGYNYSLLSTFRQPHPTTNNAGWWYDYNSGVGVFRSSNGGDNLKLCREFLS